MSDGWRDDSIDPKAAETLTGGVDVGAVSSQAVILAGDRLYAHASVPSGAGSPGSARRAMDRALAGTPLALEDLQYVVGTGHGRVDVPFSHRAVTEIACHARGGRYLFGPEVRTLVDIGGQDMKAIRCDERGRVTSFLLNDQCAAGTGRGLMAFADHLGIPIEWVGAESLAVDEEPPPLDATCVVFAKSEATGLLESGWGKSRVLAAYCSALARRVVTLLERIGLERELAFTGGIGRNQGVVTRVARALGVEPLTCEHDPQIAGALGAALFAAEYGT